MIVDLFDALNHLKTNFSLRRNSYSMSSKNSSYRESLQVSDKINESSAVFLYEEVNWKGRILQVIARDWLIANAIQIIVRHCLKESNGRFEKKFCISYFLEAGGRANIYFSVDFLQPVWKIQRVVSTRKIYSYFFCTVQPFPPTLTLFTA